ncbi:MAG TPA: dihydropteroate synthase [Candidatus Kapabacteria bacterium]|nr:dihydropteroate synthase [Candidatus Kapabacteria bacterium]
MPQPRPTPRIMGIVNVTPDSFSDGGRYLDHDLAIAHALRLCEEGADIIDVGGESTRPAGKDYGSGAERITAREELARVLPVIAGISAARPDVAISIDTMKAAVAREALAAGARIINDVSAGRFDPVIMDVAAEHGATYVLMHGYDPLDARDLDDIHYNNVVDEVFRFLANRIRRAREYGVQSVVADVGIGFAKAAAQSEQLLREHARFLDLGVPLLVGASRKSFIGRALGGLPPEERLYGTLAAHAVAAANGASIVRVHDVRPAREFFTVFNRLRSIP